MSCNCGKKKLKKEQVLDIFQELCDKTDKMMEKLSVKIDKQGYCGEDWPTILMNYVGRTYSVVLTELIVKNDDKTMSEQSIKDVLNRFIENQCKIEMQFFEQFLRESIKVH